MCIVTKESNPELYNSLFEDSTIEDAKKIMQNMFNGITPEQFEELKKQALENVKKNNMSAREMFEELGYKYKNLPNSHRIEFFKDKDEEMHFVYNEIIFNKKFKTIKIKGYFDLEELQAINKQVEELGWNNE